MSRQCAIITGGASGMGFAVAQALSARGGWSLHLLDMNPQTGPSAAQSLQHATFHHVDVTDYSALASTFQSIFDTDKRLDFVFANAGIIAHFNFYAPFPAGSTPPAPSLKVMDVNLTAVITTTWLAQHYMRHSTVNSNRNIVMTSSTAGLYPQDSSPTYAAAKHGVVGFARSIASTMFRELGIRVNVLCPSGTRTSIVPAAYFDTAPPGMLVPIEELAATVLMLIDGVDLGSKVPVTGEPLEPSAGKLNGKVVELSGSSRYYRDHVPYCDDFARMALASSASLALK